MRDDCNTAEANLDDSSADLIALGLNGVPRPMDLGELDSVYCPNFMKR